MPGKSRHGKGKRPHKKKSKIRQHQPVAAQPAQSAAIAPGAAVTTGAKSIPVTRAPAASPAATTTQYPFFVSELKRIGIITGIIIVVLIILVIILTWFFRGNSEGLCRGP